MSKEQTALWLCGSHQGGKVLKNLQFLISKGVTKIIVEEAGLKQQRDDLLAACEEVVATFVGLQPGSIGWQVVTKIAQAIAKAKGLKKVNLGGGD